MKKDKNGGYEIVQPIIQNKLNKKKKIDSDEESVYSILDENSKFKKKKHNEYVLKYGQTERAKTRNKQK